MTGRGETLDGRRVALFGAGLVADAAVTILGAAGAEVILGRPGGDGTEPTLSQIDVAVVFDGDEVNDLLRTLTVPTVLVASGEPESPAHLHAVLSGAVAVVPPDGGGEALIDAVARVGRGEAVLHPRLVRSLAERARRAALDGAVGAAVRLTPREHSVLECIVRGLSVKQTAARLGIAPKTVENTQSRLYKRLGVRNRAQAVLAAHEYGLVG